MNQNRAQQAETQYPGPVMIEDRPNFQSLSEFARAAGFVENTDLPRVNGSISAMASFSSVQKPQQKDSMS